jgi:hypothetical protein
MSCNVIANLEQAGKCGVLPGLDNVSCLSSPVPPRLVACVMSSLPSARLSPEGSRLVSYPCICVVCCRACMHSRHARHVHQPSGAGPHLSVWLAAPRGAAGVWVSSCLVPSDHHRQRAFWPKPFTSPIHPWSPSCFPLLSRAPMTKHACARESLL